MTLDSPLFGVATDTGPKPINEDSYYAFIDKKQQIGFALIADGMGGHQAGTVASKLAVKLIKQWWNDSIAKKVIRKLKNEYISRQLDGLFILINEQLLKMKEDEGLSAGTTCSLLFFFKNEYIIKHVGDSRIYILPSFNASYDSTVITPNTQQTEMRQLTQDHSWVQSQFNLGIMTKEEAHSHPKRNILLQCLGLEKGLDIYTHKGKYQNGDMFLLASDGFYGAMSDKELLVNLKLLPPNEIQLFCDFLMHSTLQDYDITDNITFVLVSGILLQKKKRFMPSFT